MKAITVALATAAANQNFGDGRSPDTIAPSAAVASGSNAFTTALCDEFTKRDAHAVNNGQPTTTPNATITSRPNCARVGNG